MERLHEFDLMKRNFISHFSICSKSTHVTMEGGRLVTIRLKQQTFKEHGGMASQVIYFLIEFSESTKQSFSEPNEIFQCC